MSAADPFAVPDLTGGSASDSLKQLLQMLGNRSTMLDPSLGNLTGLSGQASDVYKNAFANQNTATGLSPEAMSALRTQGTSGINDQYNSAAQSINSQLLRRGAAGGGELPGSGGDISRAYQPLYSAMEAAKTKAQTDTILADEAQKQKTLYQNQQLAQTAANDLYGNQASLFNAGNNALGQAGGVANSIADLEGPNLLKLLATAAITGTLNPSAGGAGGGLGGLIKGTGLNDSGHFGVLGDVLGGIFKPNSSGRSGPSSGFGFTSSGGGGGGTGGGPGISFGNDSLGGQGLQAAIKYAPQIGSAIGDAAGAIGSGVGAAGSAIGSAASAAGSAIGSGVSSLASAAIPLLTNPITAVAGAAILATTLVLKSQAHWEANTLVKDVQQPFGDNLGKVVNNFDQALASGQLDRATAQQMRDQTASLINDFNTKITEFSQKGSDEKRVAMQAMQTMATNFGARADYPNLPSYDKILGKMDQEIAGLPA